jgi:predicted ATPase
MFADALALQLAERAMLYAAARPAASTKSAMSSRLVQPVPLVGREQDAASVIGLMGHVDTRLLTLTGPGGVGKTSLAGNVATTLQSSFAGGYAFVDLVAAGGSGRVVPAVAQAINLRETARSPLLTVLIHSLRDKELLLVLDSFEGVMEEAPTVAYLLRECPHLKLLVTSRSPLRLRNEQEYMVQPLTLPFSTQLESPTDLLQYPAIALFVRRVRLTRPDLEIGEEEIRTIAEICCRLDGLPLAIELAAARLKHLPLPTLRHRLEHRLQVLTGGPGDLPARQQRMRDTIAWSYNLLNPGEQDLFRQLSVFIGSWSLEAAEAVCVCGVEECDTLGGLAALVDKSLVMLKGIVLDEPRYGMLDTIREYALEQLVASGSQQRLLRRHAEYYVQFAEQVEPTLLGGNQSVVYAQLEGEHDNIREALKWLLENGETELALRLAGAIWQFWQERGNIGEGRSWLERGLAGGPRLEGASEEPTPVRAKALWGASWLAFHQGDYSRSTALSTEYLSLARKNSDLLGVRNALTGLGMVALARGSYPEAIELLEESLEICRQLGTSWHLATSFLNLGLATMQTGDHIRTQSLLEDALKLYRDLGNATFVARTVGYLGYAALLRGESALAEGLFAESLAAFLKLEEKRGVAEGLDGLAVVSASNKRTAKASRLAGAAEAIRQQLGIHPLPTDRSIREYYLQMAREGLGESAWKAAWEEGKAMSLEEAIEYAHQVPVAQGES